MPKFEKPSNDAGFQLVWGPKVRKSGDQFKIDEGSPFIQKIQAQNLPIACNVSGHTGSLLLGAMLYGGLNKIELSEYLLAAFSFLTLARAHTFHEVMAVGETVGLPFSYSDYATSLPENIREYRAYRHISQLFPQYLPSPESSDTSPTTRGLHVSR